MIKVLTFSLDLLKLKTVIFEDFERYRRKETANEGLICFFRCKYLRLKKVPHLLITFKYKRIKRYVMKQRKIKIL